MTFLQKYIGKLSAKCKLIEKFQMITPICKQFYNQVCQRHKMVQKLGDFRPFFPKENEKRKLEKKNYTFSFQVSFLLLASKEVPSLRVSLASFSIPRLNSAAAWR